MLIVSIAVYILQFVVKRPEMSVLSSIISVTGLIITIKATTLDADIRDLLLLVSAYLTLSSVMFVGFGVDRKRK